MKKTLLALIIVLPCLMISCGDDYNPANETPEFKCNDENPTPVFVEKDGLLIIESESVELGEDWVLKTDVENYTGSGYIFWNGKSYYSNPGNGLMTYQIFINNPGTYRFQWRSVNMGEDHTENNDAWLRFDDADDFFGKKEKDGSLVYPGGSGKTPEPEGQSKENWFKIYQNKPGDWCYRTHTSDNDAHDVYVTFNKAGSYTLEVSGRSEHFGIDRMMLYLESIEESVATDPETVISEIKCN